MRCGAAPPPELLHGFQSGGSEALMPSRAIQRRELSLSTSMPSHLAYSRTSATRNPFASSALLQAYELLPKLVVNFGHPCCVARGGQQDPRR